MPNGTPRTAWANVATMGVALAGCVAATAQAGGTIQSEQSKENRSDAKGYLR
jgi:outer membrane lipoprotein SlyB